MVKNRPAVVMCGRGVSRWCGWVREGAHWLVGCGKVGSKVGGEGKGRKENWGLTGWEGGENHASNALVETAEEKSLVDAGRAGVDVRACPVGGLESRFDRVERVD